MFVVDANVLLYAVNADAEEHEAARSWLDGALAGGPGVGFPWLVVVAFVRIVTNGRIMPDPMTVDEAVAQVEAWLDAPAAVVVEPMVHHMRVWSDVLRSGSKGANLVNDAHIAALALEHRASIVSFDRDFQRFDGVRHLVPSP